VVLRFSRSAKVKEISFAHEPLSGPLFKTTYNKSYNLSYFG